ncbi:MULTISPECIES: zinc-ribbon domain-containing protein [Desulfococcus]|jgi:predicted Zn finger-like uncharacterized protein|uniref:MJ0042 family finger-like protein n=1 Tax=Desulfococcus multivorans DSM 2059 TaxID=1121405 RepID=S7VF04_DESML|nr:zinc-ribbon domain-containing protein [Desulfococcus multivorans]AOY60393.1 zinc finger/thioredoxin domain protein [Desulfococcus multivorans]AQV02492.1 hypothetical protein B2D07_18105 [Desulfococcus multivorans]EPR43063.1 MJ0042 family finger-like protein [Desulfococcus multivorans DSM 2059]MDX9817817.1 zinc-ribbon domain-containing protein [Desulfococcus multivorans]SJZ60505.1 MJ0042 family finger-like domain-containing protein [Desulfococcus multivorans DSM 2059]
MKVNCPECLAAHFFEDAEVPEGGMSVKCKICGTPFRVEKVRSPRPGHEPDEAEMTCPRCFITQKKSDTCMCCGMTLSQSHEQPSMPESRQDRHTAAARTEDPVVWNGPTPQGPDAIGELFRGLFDLSFDHLITPGMIKVLYALLLIFGGAVTLILVNYFLFSVGNYGAAAAAVMIYLLAVVVVRIQAEFLLVFFMLGKHAGNRDARTVREDGAASRERIGACRRSKET